MRVHSFESLAALDGEGLRYAVFLAGCPLRCACCHNPDTQSAQSGQDYPVEVLLQKLLRCKPYFDAGHGGVTFSGGEPLLQAEELVRLCDLLRENGVNYTLDTAACMPLTEAVRTALRGASLVLCDLKFPTEEQYRSYTGGSLERVLDTLRFLRENAVRTRVRTVVIPGVNDSEAALDAYLELLRPLADGIEQYELLGFHTRGFFKYEQLGLPNPLADTPPMDTARLRQLQAHCNALVEKTD